MNACPFCQATLSESDFKSEKCPKCGSPLRGGPPSTTKATVDSDSLSHTVDSDAVDLGPQIPPSSNIGATTVDFVKIAQTLDSVDLPVKSTVTGGKATVETSPLSPTRESIHLEQSGPGTRDSSIADSAVDQTIDSVDLPLAKAKDGHGTVSDRQLDATIDSTAIDSVTGAVASGKEKSTVEQTLDSAELAAPPQPAGGTVSDRKPGPTVGADSFDKPGEKPGTVADRQVKGTVDSKEFPAVSPAPGTVPDGAGQATYDSGDVSSRDAKQVDQMWRGANIEKASPRMTIKGREAKQQTTKTSLVIQPRHFREAKTPEPTLGSDADYDLLKMLGQGGMGVVYSARQASIDRTVAVKMLKPDMARDEGQRHKFLAEAVITGDLDHPNIVPIYDLGKNREGALFYAMKKVQGTPWDKIIHKKSLSENLDILLKVADAVAFAHNRSVVHRDLKPENIMLGDFGEVLVMDWGLALPFGKFEKSRSIQPSVSMGGTPAYMAPEMATGPFDKIGPSSDVYLLGAILYEIVAGKPPHTGKDVMKCLFAAAKNDIQPTEKSGELIHIALKAMSTKQPDRYQSVQEFQAAIREYEAHSASIAMAARAEEGLEKAQQTNNYDTFAQAVFEFQESLSLWPNHTKASNGVSRAKLAYALCALGKGDLDLAESLLDMQDPVHGEALVRVAEAKREREARQQRLKANRRLIRQLVSAFVITVTGGLVVVSYQSFQVKKQRDLAVKNEESAMRERKKADEQKEIAVASEKEAQTQKAIAVVERDNANKAREEEQRQRLFAVQQEQIAKQNETKAVEAEKVAKENETKAVAAEKVAKQERDKAEYETYIALIGLAAAKIEENAFGYARDLLNQCKPELRNWEWGRLMYLCQQSVLDVDAGAPVDAIAFSPDGKRFAIGGWSGQARVYNASDGSVVSSVPHGGLYVYAVAFSPVKNEIATGSSDPKGYVSIWNADTGELVRTLPGHGDGVLSVAYSRDGRRLLTASFDNTARLWNADTGQLIRTLAGHTWWVWSAAFSPDEKQIVTASQDGTALVWSVENGQHGPSFMGHQGPVYAAAFSPDGEHVVTGGYDKRVLMWKPSDLVPFNYEGLVAGEKIPAPRYQALDGHLGAVRSVAYSHDGKLIVSGGHDNTVRVWNAQFGQLVKTLRGHDSWVRSCAFAPDGKRVISGGRDNFARLWDIAGYEEARVLQGRWLRGHDDAVMAVAFSPKGDQIVTASRDRTARAWDPLTGQPTVSFDEGHSFLASSAVYYPLGKRLATAAVDNTTRVWDVTTGVQLLELKNTGRASAIAVSSRGNWLLTGGNQTKDTWIAQLWDAETGELLHQLPGHRGEVTAVAFSPDDRFCFTGDSHGTGALWSTQTGQQVRRLDWHTSKIAAATFLANGRRLITASDDKTVNQWNTERLADNPASVVPLEKLILKHDESVLSLDVVSDLRLAITCTTSGRVRLWDLDRAVELRSLPVGKTNVNAVSLSRNGRLALTVHPDDKVVRLWDVSNARQILMPAVDGQPAGAFLDLNTLGGLVWSATFSPAGDNVVTIGGNEARLWDARAEIAQHRELMSFSPHAAVVSVSYSSDGKRLVTGSWDGTARIWNAHTGKAELKLIGGHTGYVNNAVFSPHGEFVLTTSDDKTAKLWDAVKGKVLRTFTGHMAAVRFGVFSPDGSKVLTASDDKTARIWNTETAELLRELKSHEWGVLCASFTVDGTRVITGSDDNSARIWDVASGDVLWTLSGHTAAVTSVAFAPDGKRVLTASDDFTAKLWDAETGKEILNLKGHKQELTSVTFSRDGRYAITGSQDGTAIVWLTADWTKLPPGE